MIEESFIDIESYEGAIIAMKGLPCTGKTRVATQICDWAKLPMLCIDDFIGAPDNNIDIANESWEEAERLQVSVLEQAFTTLCRVARRQQDTEFRCAVIKSRLSSPFELEQLISKLLVDSKGGDMTLLIVECQVRNKHRWHYSFDEEKYEKTWYRPRRWNDIEKAKEDHVDPQSLAHWDLHLQHLIQHLEDSPPLIRRLVVDPYYDLDLPPTAWTPWSTVIINPIFTHAINHLLMATHAELNHQNPYVVEFDEFRISRANEILNASTSSTIRSKDLCEGDGCLFKYKEELRVEEDDGEGSGCFCCGVCEQKVVSGEAGYTCHYCILTLHKSCAEVMDSFEPLSLTIKHTNLDYYIGMRLTAGQEKHACNSHLQEFNANCDSCRFQMVLKGRMLPAVVNHDHHPHPLSLRTGGKSFICKACGVGSYRSSYVCRICEWYYHILCVFMPEEWQHVHGGHEHVLKRKYSHDDKEQEDYWCDVCFEDLDPYYWFYSCPSCPYYTVHLYCAGFYPREFWFRL